MPKDEKQPDPEPKAPTQEDIDKAVYDATHDRKGNPVPIVVPEP